MSEKSFLDQAAEFTYQQLERVGGDPAKLDPPLQTIAILYTIQAMIDNGGFRYIFENNAPLQPPYSLYSEAYRRIGAFAAADNLDKAVALFPFPDAHLHPRQRNDFMDSLDEEHELFLLGDTVCGDESVWTAMEAYARKHSASFSVH